MVGVKVMKEREDEAGEEGEEGKGEGENSTAIYLKGEGAR